jgi:hypothetical protein
MNIEDVKDKSVAMIVWNTEQEDDVYVYLGTLQNIEGQYAFINEGEGWKVSLEYEHLSRLQPYQKS